jgi:hypothetical protein
MAAFHYRPMHHLEILCSRHNAYSRQLSFSSRLFAVANSRHSFTDEDVIPGMPSSDDVAEPDQQGCKLAQLECQSPAATFIQQVTSFLEEETISYRQLGQNELHHVLQAYSNQVNTSRIDQMKTILNNRTLLFVGADTTSNLLDAPNNSFVLHICPTLQLSYIQDMIMYSQYQSDCFQSTPETVASYAWLNAMLTNAFLDYSSNSTTPNTIDNSNSSSNKQLPIIHLHQDVWNRSPSIVQSRIKSKVGIHRSRIYARKTIATRIPKSVYLPFLETNHLWGGTSAKSGYGLYATTSENEQELVAVATFSSKRKVSRANSDYYSFELLRFCTKLDTTIVGGLTKLISAFVKHNTKSSNSSNRKDNGDNSIGIDIITSIDRDFGSNTWPNFETVDVMNPIPMFVGVDGIRRHGVGAGLVPLDLEDNSVDSFGACGLLRAGLPLGLVNDMNSQAHEDNDCSSWDMAAENGFHPVFDAGVERLMHVVRRPGTDDDLILADLWEQSVPQFVTEHYSSNRGIEQMIRCVRENKIL